MPYARRKLRRQKRAERRPHRATKDQKRLGELMKQGHTMSDAWKIIKGH